MESTIAEILQFATAFFVEYRLRQVILIFVHDNGRQLKQCWPVFIACLTYWKINVQLEIDLSAKATKYHVNDENEMDHIDFQLSVAEYNVQFKYY